MTDKEAIIAMLNRAGEDFTASGMDGNWIEVSGCVFRFTPTDELKSVDAEIWDEY